jgi:dynein heavy chain
LEQAKIALSSLDKNSIVEIKSFPNPPKAVVMVMEAVNLFLGEKIDWGSIKQTLGDVGAFLSRLQNYDVTKTSEKILEKIRTQYLSKAEFDPTDVRKKSVAAASMCIWVKALNNYSIVVKKVEPKQRKYNEVKSKLDAANKMLEEKKSEVKKVKDAVADLKARCQEMQDERDHLEFEADRCEKRMGRAEKLLVLLADEGVRWKETVEVLQEDLVKLVGNVFISCACNSYYGAFTGEYRQRMVDKWV